MSKTIKSKITNVTEYLETLNRQDYWRLFVDGFRQKDTYESTNSLGGFRESQLGSKYIDGYTIESALEPYITISPELDLEFKDSSEDLFSSQSILSYFDDIHAKLLSMPYPYDFDVTGDLPSYNDNPCLAPRDDFI
ncbi:MAG: hypothetical protein AB8B68_03665 [Rickettsiaceae bacterium]